MARTIEYKGTLETKGSGKGIVSLTCPVLRGNTTSGTDTGGKIVGTLHFKLSDRPMIPADANPELRAFWDTFEPGQSYEIKNPRIVYQMLGTVGYRFPKSTEGYGTHEVLPESYKATNNMTYPFFTNERTFYNDVSRGLRERGSEVKVLCVPQGGTIAQGIEVSIWRSAEIVVRHPDRPRPIFAS